MEKNRIIAKTKCPKFQNEMSKKREATQSTWSLLFFWTFRFDDYKRELIDSLKEQISQYRKEIEYLIQRIKEK